MNSRASARHLQVLRRARMAEMCRTGLFACYRLAADDVHRFWEAIRAVALPGRHGFMTNRLESGLREWLARGLPVATTPVLLGP